MEKKSYTLKSPIRCSAVYLLGEVVMVCCFISVVALPSFSYDGQSIRYTWKVVYI
jgi:hypothetical protein